LEGGQLAGFEQAVMRNLVLYPLLLSLLVAPSLARESEQLVYTPKTSRTLDPQNQKRHDLLLRLGQKVAHWNDSQKVLDQIRDLATTEQLESLSRVRISLAQFRSLAQLIQDNIPSGGLTRENWPAVRKQITPKAEDILGSEQFDLVLELVPSPQQFDKLEALLKKSLKTPEGQAVRIASEELSASLSTEQQSALNPFLKALPKDEGSSGAPTPAKPKAQAAKDSGESRLVLLRKDGLGEFYAELTPEIDYTIFSPRRYQIDGADPALLAGLGTSSGLPVRLKGQFGQNRVQLAQQSLLSPPALQAIPGGRKTWRGSLVAKLVRAEPAILEVQLGSRQVHTANLDLTTKEQRQQIGRLSPGSLVQVTGNFFEGSTPAEPLTVTDPLVELAQPNTKALDTAILLQASEQFFENAVQAYLSRPDALGTQKLVHVSNAGATLLGCQPGQVRLYGTLAAQSEGLDFLEITGEVVCKVDLQSSKLRFTPVPGTLKLGTHTPFDFSAPTEWSTRIEQILAKDYTQGYTFELPSDMRESLLKNDILTAAQLDGSRFESMPSKDRRTSLASLVVPAAQQSPLSLNPFSSMAEQAAIAVAGPTINQALQQRVPKMLPIRRDVPAHLRNQDGVSLNEIEITELSLAFENGEFLIKNCAVQVHWTYALFSGVEPAMRFSGKGKIELQPPTGDSTESKAVARLKIDNLQFLSPRILSGSPQEQQSQKDKLIQALQDNPFEAPAPTQWGLTSLGPNSALKLSGIEHVANPSMLLLQLQLKP
jgi:hypothetical protein